MNVVVDLTKEELDVLRSELLNYMSCMDVPCTRIDPFMVLSKVVTALDEADG